MAALTDPDRLAAYRDALANWRFDGFTQFEISDQARRWIRFELGNIPFLEIRRLMHEYVAGGGEIDEVRETRPEWRALYDFHYDLRFSILGKPTYIETRLDYHLPVVADEATILVVNIHAP